MGNCVWLLRQDDHHLFYKVLGEMKPTLENKCNFSKIRLKIDYPIAGNFGESNIQKIEDDWHCIHSEQYYESLLRTYFRLDIDLMDYYKQWSDAHCHFQNEATHFYAVRVLNQDPIENLFSFICSQNNHISR